MTLVEYGNGCSIQYFNSHPHEEDDPQKLLGHYKRIYFNSHPHEEDDERVRSSEPHRIYFNSHPHEEDDSLV